MARQASSAMTATRALAFPIALAACASPAPRSPAASAIAPRTLEIGRPGGLLSGVAGDAHTVFAALTTTADLGHPATTAIEALRAETPTWRAELDGSGGPLVVSAHRVIAALGGSGSAAGIALRGEPGAALAALDAATGTPAWQLAIDATEWSVITSLAAIPDGVIAAGSFAGTLRIGDRVVSSAGKADGFVARIATTGPTAGVAWLIRLGGPGADAVQGVAAAGDRIAIAGTFTAGADVLGQPLAAFDDRSPASDGFVAELDSGGALRWAQSFGGKLDDAVAGVAIDARGAVAVAASVRGTLRVGGADVVARGPADALVAWWTADGAPGTAIQLGGSDFDGLRAIAAIGDRVVVAGFYSGAIQLGDRALAAAGGDDAFIAALDATGRVTEAWPISGDGREEITTLAAIPGGFVAGVTHTAAAMLDGAALPAPRDPMTGAAILVRPVR
jgi:hypothetical protein